jgi:NAD-dependent protein deacetylase/lipoamidase
MDDGRVPPELARAARLVADARRIVAITGAGISTDSGIPDFRGPKGLWTRNPGAERASSLEHYLGDPAVRRAAWQARLSSPVWSAQPNPGHRALVAIERSGRLHALVTQNTDGLHQRAGTEPALVVEVHGSAWWTRCWECGDRRPVDVALARVRAGEADPPCALCGGILKSDTISFGQSLVPEVIDRALRASRDCDLLLAVGSTLSVYPAASCVPIASRASAAVVIVNGSPTEMDGIADVVLRGPISTILPALVGVPRE